MKKIILFGLMAFVGLSSFSQTLQASLGAGSLPTRVKVYVKPSASQTPCTISTLQFNVGVATTVTPKPSMSIVSTTLSGVTWVVTEATEGGYYNFNITTAASPIQFNTTADTEVEIMEVQFSGGPVNPNNVALVTLPDGGMGASSGNSLFLSTGSLRSIGNNLYYNRGSVTVNNQFSYDENLVVPGTTTSTATIGGVILPVRMLSFDVFKQNNDALIKWEVTDDQENDHFEIERSLDGVNFIKIEEVRKKPGNGNKAYDAIDRNVRALNKPVVHYRIKDVDVNGRYSYTKIIPIRYDLKGQIALYPNPAKDGFYVAIPYQNPDQSRVQLQLINKAGQVLETKQITKTMATNYYYNLNPAYASGDYTLRIFEEQNLVDTKKIVVVR